MLQTPDAATLRAMFALYTLLAVASGIVGQGRWVHPDSPLRKQVNAWWRIFPWFSAAWLTYPLGPVLLFVLIAALAWRELAQHRVGASAHLSGFCAAALGLQLMLVVQWHAQLWTMAVVPAAAIAQLAVFWRSQRSDHLLRFLFLAMCAGVANTLYLQDLPLAASACAAWFFLLFVVTALNDVGQFIFGKRFGKQKIAQRISPNKTWQGLMGGVLVSICTAVVLGRYLQLAPTWFLLPLGALMSLAGFWGDLGFSAAKRFLGIKDFSNLIPGHGGILDRVDSLVLTAPLLYVALRWVLP